MEKNDDLDELDRMVLEEGKKSPSKRVLVCPVCKSVNVSYYLGGQTGYIYMCNDCDYVGAFILEKE